MQVLDPREQMREARLLRSGVPARFLGPTVRSLAVQAAARSAGAAAPYEAVAGWLASLCEESARPWLLLTGAAGTGKTALAVAALAAAERTYGGEDFCFATAVTYAESLRKQDEVVSNAVRRASFLVLDDLGAEYATYFSNQALDELLASRYERPALTVVTTNLSLSQIAESYSERLVDRFRGAALVIEMNGPSWRGQKGEVNV